MPTKAVQIRLRPTSEQERAFVQQANAHRAVWNWCCRESDAHYATTKTTLPTSKAGADNLMSRFIVWKSKPENAWIATTANATNAREAIRDFDKARKRFFQWVKTRKGRRVGMPRPRAFRQLPRGFAVVQGVSFPRGELKLGRLGLVKMLSPGTELKAEFDAGHVASIVRITQKRTAKHRDGRYSGWWYASFSVETEAHAGLPNPFGLTSIGCDIGHGEENYLVLNTGDNVRAPQVYKKNLLRLQRLHRRLSRKVKGSNRRKEAKRRIARLSMRIVNQRDSHAHAVSNDLLRRFDIVCLESHSLQKQAKTHGRGVHEAAHGTLRKMLEYKAVARGKIIVYVDPYYPSTKTCSVCGLEREPIPLESRSWQCSCGAAHERDHNAAINIHLEGLQTLLRYLNGDKSAVVKGLESANEEYRTSLHASVTRCVKDARLNTVRQPSYEACCA